MDIEVAKVLGAAVCMGIGSMGPALGVGNVGAKAMEAMARNPQVMDKMFTNMIVAAAITESSAIYALVVSLIILFVS